jgi:hypothetical protein
MKLNFTNEEQISIAYLAQCLIKADGLSLLVENVCWNTVALKMGWEVERIDFPETYDQNAALAVLDGMDEDKKRFVTALFTMIILADGKIAPEEAELLHLILSQAHMLEITAEECNNVLEGYFS